MKSTKVADAIQNRGCDAMQAIPRARTIEGGAEVILGPVRRIEAMPGGIKKCVLYRKNGTHTENPHAVG